VVCGQRALDPAVEVALEIDFVGAVPIVLRWSAKMETINFSHHAKGLGALYKLLAGQDLAVCILIDFV
jgi:hypothetical protein